MERGDQRIPAACQAVDVRAVIQQRLHQRKLHACLRGMHTGGDFAQCRARSSRTVGPVRRVDLGAGIKQELRDVNGVLWCLLTKALDAVGRDVLQQRRLMLARRPRSDQRRPIRPKEPLERRHVSGDDGACIQFPLVDYCQYGTTPLMLE